METRVRKFARRIVLCIVFGGVCMFTIPSCVKELGVAPVAQERTLTGTVVDKVSNSAIPNAAIVIEPCAGGWQRTTVTDSVGTFSVGHVPVMPDVQCYRVTVLASGYDAARIDAGCNCQILNVSTIRLVKTQCALNVSPLVLNVSTVYHRDTSVTVTISDSGNQPINILSISVQATQGAGIVQIDQTGLKFPLTVQPHASTVIRVLIQGATAGTFSGSISIATDCGNGIIPTAATIAPCGISISPNPVNFALLAVGGTSSTKTVTITNSSAFPARIDSIRLAFGASTHRFAIDSSTMSRVIPAGGSTTVNVTMSTQWGDSVSSALLEVYTQCQASATVAQLSGQIDYPVCNLSAYSITYPVVYVGTTLTDSVVIRNASRLATLQVQSISVDAPFQLVPPAPAVPRNLRPGDTLTIRFQYTVQSNVRDTARIHIITNSTNNCGSGGVVLMTSALDPPKNRIGGLGKWSPVTNPGFQYKGWNFETADVAFDSVIVCGETSGPNPGDPPLPVFPNGATAQADFRFDGFAQLTHNNVHIQAVNGLQFIGNIGSSSAFLLKNISFSGSPINYTNQCLSNLSEGDMFVVRCRPVNGVTNFAVVRIAAFSGVGAAQELYFDYYYPVLPTLPRIVRQ
jgi:hypothetical protein